MGQQLCIEHKRWTSLITTRTANSRLWFIHNKELENQILGSLARYQEMYGAIIYAFILMGNHYHLVARFPRRNRAHFMRAFNSMVARLVGRLVNEHGRRAVWARRYAAQLLPRNRDIKNWFMYAATNPVSSGLVSSVEQYDSYNSFNDATLGIERTYVWIDWSKYLLKKRYNDEVRPEDFSKEHVLKYSRLPGYEDYTPQEYRETLLRILRERERDLVHERKAKGHGFMGPSKLRAQARGSRPKHTKTSHRHSIRPVVLSLCAKTRNKFIKLYFATLDAFKQASEAFLAGDMTAIFPTGTYPPPRLAIF